MKELTRVAPASNGTSRPDLRPRRAKRLYWIVGALLILGVFGIAFLLRPKPGPQIATAPVVRKTLVSIVTASGTVNPRDTISVGAQVSGTIQTIVADSNDRVRKGQVLARLDPTLFQAALDQAQGCPRAGSSTLASFDRQRARRNVVHFSCARTPTRLPRTSASCKRQ